MQGPPAVDSVPDASIDRGASGGAGMAAPNGSSVSRVREWFWRGEAIAAVRAQVGAGARERELERRARVAAELAALAYQPRERFVDGDATFLACGLYREAVCWALRALTPRATPDSSALWSTIDPELLQRIAPDEAAVETLHRSFTQQRFAGFAELPLDEQARTIERLRALTVLLLARLETSQRAIDALWVERLLRCGLIVLALVGGALVAVALDRYGPDLARGKPWRASSDWNTGGCKSPQQSCDDSPYYFFHTRVEGNPWVELDLGGPVTFTRIRVENREDCCYERAVPMVFEVSNDHTKWDQLGWRKQPFTSLTLDVPPTTARYLRLRVKGQGPLHLKSVRVQP